MCKITVVHNLITYFQDHCISFALLQGILYFLSPQGSRQWTINIQRIFLCLCQQTKVSPSPFICSISGSADQARLRTVIIGYNVCRCTASSSVRWTRISLTPPSEGGVSAQDLSFGKFTRTMSKPFCENCCTPFPALKQKGGPTKCCSLGLPSVSMPLSSTAFGVGCYILALLRPQRHVSYF